MAEQEFECRLFDPEPILVIPKATLCNISFWSQGTQINGEDRQMKNDNIL